MTLKQPASSQSVVAPRHLTREAKQAYAKEMFLGLGVKNKLYMLDITASSVGGRPGRELIFSGAVEERSIIQNGHVVVGFIATQAVSEIEFQLDSGEMGEM